MLRLFTSLDYDNNKKPTSLRNGVRVDYVKRYRDLFHGLDTNGNHFTCLLNGRLNDLYDSSFDLMIDEPEEIRTYWGNRYPFAIPLVLHLTREAADRNAAIDRTALWEVTENITAGTVVVKIHKV